MELIGRARIGGRLRGGGASIGQGKTYGVEDGTIMKGQSHSI